MRAMSSGRRGRMTSSLVGLVVCCAIAVASRDLPQELRVVGEAAFGTVDLHSLSPRTVQFSLRNDSGSGIRVRQVVSGCGCVRIDWPDAVTLPPGGSRQVTAVLEPLRAVRGENKYALQAVTDRGVQNLGYVTYTYAPLIEVVPRVIWVAGDEPQGTAQLALGDSVDAAALGATSDDEALHFEVIAASDSRRAELRVSVRADHPPGPIDAIGFIRHGIPNREPVEFRVRGFLQGPLVLSPSVIVASGRDSSSIIERTLTITNRTSGEPVGDLKLSTTSELIRVQLADDSGTSKTFKVELDCTVPGMHDERVLVEAANGAILPVRVVWKARKGE